MKSRKYTSVLLLFFVFTSCNSDNCLVSRGDVVEEIFYVESFSSLEINDVFFVKIKQDSNNCVIIKAGENIIDGISCKVIEGNLIIDNNNDCNWFRSFDRPEITITTPFYETIVINGESDVISQDTIFADEFEFRVYSGASSAKILVNCNTLKFSLNQGTGNFEFMGESSIAYFYNLGTGFVNAQDMKSDYSYVTNISTGDIFVNVNISLEVKLLSQGDIYYYGDPASAIIDEQSSTGELIHLF